MKNIVRILSCYVLLLSASCIGQAQSNGFKDYKLHTRIAPGDNLRWDYLAVDTLHRHLFVSHQTKVLVIDMDRDSVIGEIPHTLGVHGIAVAYGLNKGFVSDGMTASVTVFDLTTLKTIDTIPGTGTNPDAILYDPFTSQLFTFNGRSNNATVIDPVAQTIKGTINLPGKPEFAVSDEAGKLYVNIENKNLVVEIDAHTLHVMRQWSLAPGDAPSGLAIDRSSKLLFSVCGDNKTMVVSDIAAGTSLTTVPIGAGADAVAFDPDTRLIYSSNGEGNVTIIKEVSRKEYKTLQSLTTQPSCRTIALDPKSKKIYLSGAKVQPGTRTIEPGSFEVLVFGN